MLTPVFTTIVILSFIFVFGVLLPILDAMPATRKFVSYRWVVVMTYLTLALGVILDFNHLETSVRSLVIGGSLTISGLWLLVRTWEKAKCLGYTMELPRIRAKKGDLSVDIGNEKREHGDE